MAKIIMPDPDTAPALDEADAVAVAEAPHGDEAPANIIMAAAQGAQTGVRLAVAVGAMVLAFVALVALANGLLGGVGNAFVRTANALLAKQHLALDERVADALSTLSFQQLLGYLFAPLMVLLNVPWHEAGIAGGLFGEKIVLNEFVAYIALGKDTNLSPHTVAVVTFALCGFANFSSIAIQMAVTGSLAPNQRPTIATLGLRALLAASLANLMSAAFAGLLLAT